jgi:hypothetical protein
MNRPKLIAVVGELVAVDNFIKYFVGGEVYLDKENNIKKAIGGGTLRTMSISVILNPRFWSIKGLLTKKHSDIKEGKFSTNGLSSGGILVASKTGELKYLHLEKVPTDAPEPDEVLNNLTFQPRLSLATSKSATEATITGSTQEANPWARPPAPATEEEVNPWARPPPGAGC